MSFETGIVEGQGQTEGSTQPWMSQLVGPDKCKYQRAHRCSYLSGGFNTSTSAVCVSQKSGLTYQQFSALVFTLPNKIHTSIPLHLHQLMLSEFQQFLAGLKHCAFLRRYDLMCTGSLAPLHETLVFRCIWKAQAHCRVLLPAAGKTV